VTPPEVVVLPGGGGHGPSAGFVHYAGEVPARRGALVHRHFWSGHAPQLGPELADWVAGEAEPLLAERTALVIGKSLGTLAAGLTAARGLPAVWLTPLLAVPWAVPPLRRASAPFLLVGGTADQLWDGALARSLSPYVLEVEGADHGMLLPGAVGASVPVLGQVVAAVEEFLDGLGWPAAGG
jgi:hypothetical protein